MAPNVAYRVNLDSGSSGCITTRCAVGSQRCPEPLPLSQGRWNGPPQVWHSDCPPTPSHACQARQACCCLLLIFLNGLTRIPISVIPTATNAHAAVIHCGVISLLLRPLRQIYHGIGNISIALGTCGRRLNSFTRNNLTLSGVATLCQLGGYPVNQRDDLLGYSATLTRPSCSPTTRSNSRPLFRIRCSSRYSRDQSNRTPSEAPRSCNRRA